MKTETLRAFVALPLPPAGIQCLADLQEGLRSHDFKIGWVRPRNLHLTMKFLGDIQNTDLAGIASTLQQAAAPYPSFNLILQGMGVFPGMKRPRVVWAGLGGEIGALQSLAADLEVGLADHGFKQEKRGFKAHITLGRIRKRIDARRLRAAIEAAGQFEPRPFVADRLVLFKSELKPSGAEYSPLSTVELRSASGEAF